MRKRKPEELRLVLDRLFRRYGLTDRLKRAQMIDSWGEIVGERIARVSNAERIVGKKLFVSVKSSAWRNELLLMKPEIIQKINAHSGEKVIEDIKFQ